MFPVGISNINPTNYIYSTLDFPIRFIVASGYPFWL